MIWLLEDAEIKKKQTKLKLKHLQLFRNLKKKNVFFFCHVLDLKMKYIMLFAVSDLKYSSVKPLDVSVTLIV